jgi:hypothetical protein
MQGHEMAIKKWFDHHWTFVLLVTKTSLVTINWLVSITFSYQMDNWLVGNQKNLIAFKLEEWQPNFFGRQQLSTHLIGD